MAMGDPALRGADITCTGTGPRGPGDPRRALVIQLEDRGKSELS